MNEVVTAKLIEELNKIKEIISSIDNINEEECSFIEEYVSQVGGKTWEAKEALVDLIKFIET